MIRAVVWKELREQGLIAVMLTVLGGGLLVAAAAFADPPAVGAPATDVVATLGAGRLLTLMLVVTAGMVCGGALFAAEKESGTMSFLEALPTARWPLWRAKLTAGLAVALAEIAVLMAVARALDLADGAFLARLLVYALLAFAWGALGSTLASTTLGSVGVAIPAASLATFVFLLPIYVIFSPAGASAPRPAGWALFEVLMLATPLAASAWWFTAPDRARAAEFAHTATAGRAPATRGGKSGLGGRALVWLTLRQLRVTGPVLSAFALAFGFALLLPELHPLFVWPVLALAAGVLAGVTAFGDEQSHRTALYWSEHRLPVGRVWGVKVALHFALVVWLLALLALPCVASASFEAADRLGRARTVLAGPFRSRLVDELGSQVWKYAFVPAVYGFAFGHVCGLLFRKLVVATGVAVMLGGTVAGLWELSLLAGGVKHWQVWGPAAAILLTGRLLIRGWAADRAAARGPLLRLAGGAAALVLVLVGGLAYRAFQVPNDPTGADDEAFVAALPSYDENLTGREFHSAIDRFARAAVPEPVRAPDATRPPAVAGRLRIEQRLETVVTRSGWAPDDLELAAWLVRVCSDPPPPEDKPWPALVEAAADRPVGVYELPQLVGTTATTVAALDNVRRMSLVLLVRGLQLQAAGDPAAFLRAFRAVIALTRTVRHGGGLLALAAAIDTERLALHAADRWLERLAGRADLAVAAARVAAETDDPAPFDPRPYLLADRYVIRGLLRAPSQWMSVALTPRGGDPERAAAEADLVAFAWSLPWEKERTRRLVDRAPGPRADVYPQVEGRPGANLLIRGRLAIEAADHETQLRVFRRAVILKAAVRAYQIERGQPPAALADLVDRRYLARLPEDPYAEGQSFGYRVSAGETLRGSPRTPVPGRPEEKIDVALEPGRAVLWSVGTDRIDQGGLSLPNSPRPDDLVFLVPVPPPVPR